MSGVFGQISSVVSRRLCIQRLICRMASNDAVKPVQRLLQTKYSCGFTIQHSLLVTPLRCIGTTPIRLMSAEELSPENVSERVMSCVKLYDKINPELLTKESHFMKDLGLDSLDHVEVIVAIENEFSLEIPDDVAETLLTPNDIIKYICESSEITSL